MARRMLLDASSLLYRAFHALPPSIRGRDGRPVNAVFGYLDMTARLYTSRRPEALVHVQDDAIVPEARARAWPGYKAQRAPDPEGLPEQFDLLDEVLSAFGAERTRAPGWEADDAIGTLCARAAPEDEVEIVTGDRDLLQLVRDAGPAVRVLFTVKGVSELASFDEAAVVARYGVPPSRYADFATLRGDPSDGLPGVAGVGEKTAARLVAAHGSLEAILASAGGLSARLGASLRSAEAYLKAMQEVVPVRCDLRLEARRDPPDPERLARLATERRLNGPVRRLADAVGLALPAAD